MRYVADKEQTRSGMEIRRGTVTGYRATGSTGGTYNVQLPGGEGTGISCPQGAHDVNSSVLMVKMPGSNVNAIMLGAPSSLQTNAAAEGLSLDVSSERLL